MNLRRLRGLLRIIFGRTTFLVLFLLIQAGILFGAFRWLRNDFIYAYGGFTLLGLVFMVAIINKREEPNFKLAWMVPILVSPVFGGLLYLYVQLDLSSRLIARRAGQVLKETSPGLAQSEAVMERLRTEGKQEEHLASYMNRYGGYPVYDNSSVQYFGTGEEMFPQLKKELEQAEKFIFMEYFIVDHGLMWESILEILERKAKEGVEVRFMYDGMCCLVLLPYHYPRELQKKGIRAKMFAPVKPALSTYQNNRDHRKITVIDGHTAFTGGINLADEYINEKERFGYWKDTAIMVKGDAVQSFTMMFLQMWNIFEKKTEDWRPYETAPGVLERMMAPGQRTDLAQNGFVMPYGDSPLDKENVGEQVYLDILYRARSYVHIMTPYLILDQSMLTALTYAAKRGVETVIIMPHIPDKKYAYLLARTYYEELLEAGVRIYEFLPGFVHAKMFVSDDERAAVGTINLDYRSLYLHFECGAYLYKNQAISAIERDYQETWKQCREITLADCRNYGIGKKMAGRALRLIAPLM